MSNERKNLKSAILVFLALASLGLTTACLIPVRGGRGGRGWEDHGGEYRGHGGHDEHGGRGGHQDNGGRERHPD